MCAASPPDDRPLDQVTPSTGPSAERSAAREQRLQLSREEHRGNVLRFRVGLVVAVPLWAAFAVLDWVAVRFMGAGSLLVLWGIRFGLLPLAMVSLWRLYRSPLPSAALLRLMDIGLYGLAAAGVAAMAVDYGGIASRYPTGIMMILVARSAFAVQHWRHGLLPNLVVASSYPVVMAISAPWSREIAAQLTDAAALGAAVHHLFFIYGTALLALAGSHFAWMLRRELFESRSIGRYQLRHRLGKGGMGEVWAAYHSGLKRDVALKILRADAASDENAVVRFEREVKATTELTHPNTVRIFDYGVTDDGLWYYAMELLAGVTLAQLVRREGPLPPERAVHLVLQAARSLAEAHAIGIVHRDIKPANLFVTSAGGEMDFVKVLDFGIAKLSDGEPGITRVGEVAGTPNFVAPEVLQGGMATACSDVYGLGAVLYTLLAGKPPFEGDRPSALYVSQLLQMPSRPSEKRGSPLPEPLEQVVLRCLAKDPAKRYPTAAALADALEDLGLAWRPRASLRPGARSCRPARSADETPTIVAPSVGQRPPG